MNRIYNILGLVLCTVLLLSACSEDLYNNYGVSEGDKVTLSIAYQSSKPGDINISRSQGNQLENKLHNLQVFVFDEQGRLKGYKFLEENQLNQEGKATDITIKTTTGKSKIYAVANMPTNIYKQSGDITLPTTLGEAREQFGGGSENYEELVQAGAKKDFTLDQLKKIAFNRQQGQIDVSDYLMMSGSVGKGEACTIKKGSGGTASVVDPKNAVIELRRIVSKITFKIETAAPSGDIEERTFTPTSYDICNVPIEGSLIEGDNDEAEEIKPEKFENFEGKTFSAQEKIPTFFHYLPENLQNTNIPNGSAIKTYDDREQDKIENGQKVFTNAPKYGTYIILNGEYSQTNTNKERRSATVKYYIHLGNFGTEASGNIKDFDVQRNYNYTYTVTVRGVNKIETQVTTQDDKVQPGAEGIVFDYTGGTKIDLDSHYGQHDMTFKQSDIQKLKGGYRFQVSDLHGKSDVCAVGENGIEGNLNHASYDWVQFADGSNRDYADAYRNNNLKKLDEVLKELYVNRNNNSFWDNGQKTYTCFVDENYYPKLTWGQYTNRDPRTLYIANTVKESPDKRSIYANVAYTLTQQSIKTFYNANHDDTIIAYGLETYRDDNKTGLTVNTESKGTDRWNGLSNMKKDIPTTWTTIKYNEFRQACMSRNRDLNGNGQIDDDEIRWYCPAIDQYGGMWIGENALDKDARLFTNSTKDLSEPSENNGYLNRQGAEHYYSNTKQLPIFWAEEGMATGTTDQLTDAGGDKALKYIRCIRNLQSKGNGTGTTTADKYYEVNGNTVDLDRINPKALNTSAPQTSDLAPHAERGVGNEQALNNAKKKFIIASYDTNGTTTQEAAATAFYTICKNYGENGITTGWRAPNQRELCLIYILKKYNRNNNIGCRTHFSGTLRKYWRLNPSKDQMTMEEVNNIYLRCIKEEQ